jgi:hypothetical protein
MEFVRKGWGKKKRVRGLEYHVKVIGQLFGSDDDDDDGLTGPIGSCLVTSLEMATWHLKSKQFMKGTGNYSVFGDINAVHRDWYGTEGQILKRLGHISTVSEDNRGEPFELSRPKYYWSQPVLHSIIMGSPRRMMELVNNSLIELGIWDHCRPDRCSVCKDREESCQKCFESRPKPTKYDIIKSLQEGERTPILIFRYLRPKIKKTAEGTAEVTFPPVNRDRDYQRKYWEPDWCGHAVVITGWRRRGKDLEFLVNDPSPPPAAVVVSMASQSERRRPAGKPFGLKSEGGLDRIQRSREVACGGKYWVTEKSLFHDRWHPIGLYEVYSNPDMLNKNGYGQSHKSYLPEFTGNPRKSLWDRGRVEISNLDIL